MVQPLDYTLNVLSPMQRFTEGLKFGEDLLTARLARDETQQLMDMRAAQEARAVAAEQERRAARARAEKMQADLGGLVALAEGGNLTTDAINQFRLTYAQTLDDVTNVFTSMEEERKKPLKDFGVKSVTLALTGNAAAAEALYQERIDAAKNAGTPEAMQEAQALEAELATLKANPINFATAQATLLRHANYINDEQLKGLLDLANQVQGAETTEAVRTLQQRAKLSGLVPGTPEYNQFMISGGKPPEGMAVRTTPEGGIEFIQGAGAATPFREQESKDIVFAARAEGALAALDPVADQLANLGPRLLEYVPLGQGRQFQDPLFQIANNAGLEFLAAILRKDTGAAITAQEIEIYGQVYLPQPGDSPQALAQKKEARSRALRALQAPMRPEATEAVSGAVGGETPAPVPATPPAAFINNPTVQRLVQENASVGVTAESIWNAMTAEERAAYGR